MRFANMPKKYADVSLGDLRTTMYRQKDSVKRIEVAINAMKEYIERFAEMQESGKGLYLYSKEKGSGKTMSVCGLGNALMKAGHRVKFSDAPTILSEIKRTYEKNIDCEYSENELLDALVTTEVLIIDDFGTEKVTDWVNEKFYQIINQRYVNKRVTIYTSNESVDELVYDKRIKDRVLETTFTIKYPEESVRKIIAMKNSVGLKALAGKE